MTQLRKKLMLCLTAALAGVCGILCFLVVVVFKHDITTCYVSIPIFFLFVGVFSILMITKNGIKHKNNGRKRANKYMLVRTIKIFLGGTFFLLYWYIVKPEDIKGFALTFVVFYLTYLAFEAWSFIQVEKKIKNDVQQNS
jgi:cell division protein FtsW (lipid II flippase)